MWNILVRCTFLVGRRHQRYCSIPIAKTNHIAAYQPFIRPPGISEGAFQLRIDNIWLCILLLLFTIETKTDGWSDAGMKNHACAFVSVLEEYKGHRRTGLHILYILHIINISYFAHYVYSAYYAYYDLIVYRMGGCLPVNHRLRAPWISSSSVCCSSVLDTGAASSCPCGRYWNDKLRHARGISWLSMRKL